MKKFNKITYKVDVNLSDTLINQFGNRNADGENVLANLISIYYNKIHQNQLSEIGTIIKDVNFDDIEYGMGEFKIIIDNGLNSINIKHQNETNVLLQFINTLKMTGCFNPEFVFGLENELYNSGYKGELEGINNSSIKLNNYVFELIKRLQKLENLLLQYDTKCYNYKTLMFDGKCLYEFRDTGTVDLTKICKVIKLQGENQSQEAISLNTELQNILLIEYCYDLLKQYNIKLKTIEYEIVNMPEISKLAKYGSNLRKTVEIKKYNGTIFLKLDIEKLGINIDFYSNEYDEFIWNAFTEWVNQYYPEVKL